MKNLMTDRLTYDFGELAGSFFVTRKFIFNVNKREIHLFALRDDQLSITN